MIQAQAEAKLHQRYILPLLSIVYLSNSIDRQIVNIVAEPIKHELELSDSQLGLLTGLAFALLYSIVGIPVARWSEGRNRPAILAACLTVWSSFTVFCGLVSSFGLLMFCRVGVAAGEAGCSPISHSLISDYFPPEKRARALSIFGLGAPAGSLAGLFIGGLVAGTYGWRAAFWAVGLPGVLLAPLVLLVLREPAAADHGITAIRERPTFNDVFLTLRKIPSFWLVCIGSSGFSLVVLAEGAFLSSFYLRNHAPTLAAYAATFGIREIALVGMGLGLITGIAGMIGTIAGGIFTDTLGKRSLSLYLMVPAISAVIALPLQLAYLLCNNLWASLAFIGLAAVFKSTFLGPTWATVQGVAPSNMRATAAAILLMINTIIGLGCGPLFVGMLSDFFANSLRFGSAEGLRLALLSLSLLFIPVFLAYWATRRHIKIDIQLQSPSVKGIVSARQS